LERCASQVLVFIGFRIFCTGAGVAAGLPWQTQSTAISRESTLSVAESYDKTSYHKNISKNVMLVTLPIIITKYVTVLKFCQIDLSGEPMAGKNESSSQVDPGILATLRARIPADAHRKEKSREAASLLFFEHGIYPSAKVVLSYTQQGSLTDINRDLHEFWQDLRDKARVKLDAPYLPPELLESFADALARLWDQAVTNATAAFDAERMEAEAQVGMAQRRMAEAELQASSMLERAQASEAQLRQERERRETSEKRVEVQMAEIEALQSSLVKWQQQAESEARARQEAEQRFSRDLEAERTLRQHDSERYDGEIKFVKLQIDSARTAERELRDQLKAVNEHKDAELSGYRQRANHAADAVAAIKLELAEVRGLNRGLERQLASIKSDENLPSRAPSSSIQKPRPRVARALTIKRRRLR
jgi:flagellar biosynthesis GTPase FlhF